MKTLILRALSASAISLASLQAADWTVDPAHSQASFAVRHMMVSTVRGSFSGLKGTVVYDPENPAASKVNLTIDVSTIDTRNEKRDADLKSAEFFDAGKYPTITFTASKVSPGSPGKFKLAGDMTMHGVTKQVTFDVSGPELPVKDGKGRLHSGATATTKIDRTAFGLVWNRLLEGGGVTVGDEVDLTVEVELIQSKTS